MRPSPRPVTDQTKAAILGFSQANPSKPTFPKPLVNRFLTELISSNSMIFDLHDEHGRVACAVMIDLISNASNDANLEILGMRAGADLEACLSEIFRLAFERAPAGKTGYQFSLLENSPVDDRFLNAHGLKFFYATYDMENHAVAVKPIARAKNISAAVNEDSDQVFQILVRSFSKNPETSIPSRESWNANFLKTPGARLYLWNEQGSLLGFTNLVEPHAGDSTEVRTIGVVPEARGQGLGRDLLQHCLNETVRLGLQKCHLTVAVENERALALYLRSGFHVTEKYRCFRAQFTS